MSPPKVYSGGTQALTDAQLLENAESAKVVVDIGAPGITTATPKQIAALADESLPISKTATQAIAATTTVQVGGITGAQTAHLILTGANITNINLPLPPAEELVAALPDDIDAGFTYNASIFNTFTTTSIGTLTATATGNTLVGSGAIAQNQAAQLEVKVTALEPAAVTYTRVG